MYLRRDLSQTRGLSMYLKRDLLQVMRSVPMLNHEVCPCISNLRQSDEVCPNSQSRGLSMFSVMGRLSNTRSVNLTQTNLLQVMRSVPFLNHEVCQFISNEISSQFRGLSILFNSMSIQLRLEGPDDNSIV
jgi:hypothetical protein